MKYVMFAIIALFGSLSANSLSIDFGACSKIKNTITRLSCYDSSASKHKLVVKSKVIPKSNNNQWDIQTKIDPLSDKSIVSFINTTKSSKGKYGEDIYLVVRCGDSDFPEFFINWASYLGGDALVTTRFDKEKAITENWSISTDSKASFYRFRKYGDKNILDKFIESNNLTARVTPYGENPITVTFDLSGFTKSVKKYSSLCRDRF